ncbi:uncharacterized protein LOC143028992 [Oratosquilla oratoria]|uniref:uncharacterized protein LOC143028992 n=1 Tax=Oratosquilla oratoria TaxID=337810 RepID=UPI003F7616E9
MIPQLCGTVKTHKPGNPLRPIISQISSPTYQIAKSLNRLLTPYVPNSFCLSSATDFIDILKSQESFNHIASMDVTSLFTHVPIQETINIIIQKVYYSQRASLNIPENTLRQLLLACTKEVPFYSHRGDLCQQIDGVAMGSPLGVLFANFYIGAVEERVFEGRKRPKVYTRYIDDYFLYFDAPEEDLAHLVQKFTENSVLQFTTESSTDGKLPFLDVLVDINDTKIKTSVFTKATDNGTVMNARGECSSNYKNVLLHLLKEPSYTVSPGKILTTNLNASGNS